MMNHRARFRGCLLGLAVGDAVGTSLEFRPRGTFDPLTDMVGGGPFVLLPGQWTDDTSMALCLAVILPVIGLADALLLRSRRGFLFWIRACAFEICTVFGVAATARLLLDMTGVAALVRATK